MEGDEVVGEVADVTGDVTLLSGPFLFSSGGVGGEWEDTSDLHQCTFSVLKHYAA